MPQAFAVRDIVLFYDETVHRICIALWVHVIHAAAYLFVFHVFHQHMLHYMKPQLLHVAQLLGLSWKNRAFHQIKSTKLQTPVLAFPGV